MPNCKICGHPVTAGPVMHSDCLTKLVTETAEKFCDNYCVWPDMYTSQEQLERERCEGCPMGRLMKLAQQGEEKL